MRTRIPTRFLHVDELEAFIAWLKDIYVQRAIDRKYILIDWCNITGYPLTKELVARVYTEPHIIPTGKAP